MRQARKLILGPMIFLRWRLPQLIRREAGFFKWIFQTSGSLLPSRSNERRLLLVHDLSQQPFSIGDILVVQEASLVLREKFQLGKVDFAIVYNPQSPTVPDPALVSITEENAMYHLAGILPAAQANQHLGSLFIFDSHSNLARFIADNGDLYHVWPSAWKYAIPEYLYYIVVNDLLYNFHKEHGWIPHMTCRPFLADWAEDFYQKHVYPSVPVTVNIRNNKAFATHRNVALESWMEFFRDCEKRYPVKFIIICGRAEVDDRLRQFSNVIIAKDYHTGIEQDLALIQAAVMHLGAPSGPAQIAIFGAKPFLIVQADLNLELHHCLIQEGRFLRYTFASPMQRFALGECTTDLLVTEFARMWDAIDGSNLHYGVQAEAKSQAQQLSWMR